MWGPWCEQSSQMAHGPCTHTPSLQRQHCTRSAEPSGSGHVGFRLRASNFRSAPHSKILEPSLKPQLRTAPETSIFDKPPYARGRQDGSRCKYSPLPTALVFCLAPAASSSFWDTGSPRHFRLAQPAQANGADDDNMMGDWRGRAGGSQHWLTQVSLL